MISGIVPRPIGFVSTISADGKSTNLAPFSYTQMVNHDPPVIVIGFSGGSSNPKNTLKNILETKECTINMINEHMVEYSPPPERADSQGREFLFNRRPAWCLRVVSQWPYPCSLTTRQAFSSGGIDVHDRM